MEIKCPLTFFFFFVLFPFEIRWTLELFKLNINFPAESCLILMSAALNISASLWGEALVPKLLETCDRYTMPRVNAAMLPMREISAICHTRTCQQNRTERFCWPHLDIWNSMTRTSVPDSFILMMYFHIQMHWYARLAVSQLCLHLKRISMNACILMRVKLSKIHNHNYQIYRCIC